MPAYTCAPAQTPVWEPHTATVCYTIGADITITPTATGGGQTVGFLAAIVIAKPSTGLVDTITVKGFIADDGTTGAHGTLTIPIGTTGVVPFCDAAFSTLTIHLGNSNGGDSGNVIVLWRDTNSVKYV